MWSVLVLWHWKSCRCDTWHKLWHTWREHSLKEDQGKFEQVNQLIQQAAGSIVLQAWVGINTLTCRSVGTGECVHTHLTWSFLARGCGTANAQTCASDWWNGFFSLHTSTHACSNTASPVSLLRALTGPRIPWVQLYYKAQDQEQERAAYFRKRVAPLLLHAYTLMHTRTVQEL